MTSHKIKDDVDKREYRLITGSDDGSVFFWNISHDLVTDAQIYHENLQAQAQKKTGKIKNKLTYRLPEINPKFELLLSGYAQI